MKVKAEIIFETDQYNDWSKEQFDFWMNDGSGCVDNLIYDLFRYVMKERREHGCCCGTITVTKVEETT